MNRRFYCVIGVASGVFLLGGGVAQAAAAALESGPDMDPMAMRGLPTDIFTPTRGQYRLAAPIGALTERAGNSTPVRRQAEIEPNTGTDTLPGTQAGRAEGLIPGLGGNGGELLGLLGGLPGGSLLSGLTGEGPLGQLLSNTPLGALLGGGAKKPSTNNSGQSGSDNADSTKTQEPATRGDDAASGGHHGKPAAANPASGTAAANPAAGTAAANPASSAAPANPASSAAPANPAWQSPSTGQPAAHWTGDAASTGGNVAGEEPMHSTDNNAAGPMEKLPVVGGNLLNSGVLGPNGPLGRVELLGGDTFSGLPLVGDLLRGGLNLNALNNLPGVNDLVNRIGADPGKASPASGDLQAVGKLGRALLSGESTTRPTESVAGPSVPNKIDKTKVTPELAPLFGPDTLGIQALSGMIRQLPPVG